jgi:hypothetical protein
MIAIPNDRKFQDFMTSVIRYAENDFERELARRYMR